MAHDWLPSTLPSEAASLFGCEPPHCIVTFSRGEREHRRCIQIRLGLTCRRFMAAPGPAISMAASMTEDSLKGAVQRTILFACNTATAQGAWGPSQALHLRDVEDDEVDVRDLPTCASGTSWRPSWGMSTSTSTVW